MIVFSNQNILKRPTEIQEISQKYDIFSRINQPYKLDSIFNSILMIITFIFKIKYITLFRIFNSSNRLFE